MNRNLVGSTYGRFCIKFPQSSDTDSAHWASSIIYFQILRSLQDRFYKIVCQENFLKVYSNGGVKSQVIDLLESLRGIALGTRVDNLNRLFDFLHPLLAECVKILGKSFSVKNIRNLCLSLCMYVFVLVLIGSVTILCYFEKTKITASVDVMVSVQGRIQGGGPPL
jgi:hypothetical protein